jgi:hypothetical protein
MGYFIIFLLMLVVAIVGWRDYKRQKEMQAEIKSLKEMWCIGKDTGSWCNYVTPRDFHIRMESLSCEGKRLHERIISLEKHFGLDVRYSQPQHMEHFKIKKNTGGINGIKR